MVCKAVRVVPIKHKAHYGMQQATALSDFIHRAYVLTSTKLLYIMLTLYYSLPWTPTRMLIPLLAQPLCGSQDSFCGLLSLAKLSACNEDCKNRSVWYVIGQCTSSVSFQKVGRETQLHFI